VFTDDKEKLVRVMGREHEVHTATAPEQIQELTIEMDDLRRRQEMGMAAA
jgi:hypothetical protein